MSTERKKIDVDTRHLMHTSHFAVQDVYDAVIELMTNSDDAYQRQGVSGKIEIEVERHRGRARSILRVRDYAAGMTEEEMSLKLARIGGRVSGLESGDDVRGTMSRGAKDIVALGDVVFESIAQDGRYHKCEINQHFEYSADESMKTTKEIRKKLCIPNGTGTLVTLTLKKAKNTSIPSQAKFVDSVRHLVSLRNIVSSSERHVTIKDLSTNKKIVIKPVVIDGNERVKTTMQIPGYPDATAKLVISRAHKPFQRKPNRFRLGGVLIQSGHAIHEATLFQSTLENDPHALWFYGKVNCPYIDTLWNEYDDRYDAHLEPTDSNPSLLIDPSRRGGLVRSHPFTKALFNECLKRLRPLVEEERKQEESTTREIESTQTRKRLNALEKAAMKFMEDFGEEDEPAKDPNSRSRESKFLLKGFSLSPPYAQMVVGESRAFWFNVNMRTFPEIEVGTRIEIECLTNEVESDSSFMNLEPHPLIDDCVRAIWTVKARNVTSCTGVKVHVSGSITTESVIEILSCEADRYKHISTFQFSKKKYTMRVEMKRKKIALLAPISFFPDITNVMVESTSPHIKPSGKLEIRPVPELGIARCNFYLKPDGIEDYGYIRAVCKQHECSSEVFTIAPMGAELSIKIVDRDFQNQRYKWVSNVLEIASRHSSISRYLGPADAKFPGQELIHFRLLLAEIVADAVCTKLVGRKFDSELTDFQSEEKDWDFYYSEFDRLRTAFLPIAHRSQISHGEIKTLTLNIDQ